MASVIGIDVGGTGIKAGRYSAGGDLLARAGTPTPVGDDITQAVRAIARDLFDDDTVAIGVVLPGIIDRVDGVVRWSVNLGWRDVPLRSLLTGDLGVPVALEHDATAAALAEQAATGTDLFYVGLGTGIGAAQVVDGQALRGASGLAGEIGHAPVRTDGDPCTCGQTGCLEVYASAAGIARRYLARGGRSGSTAADVASAQQGEPVDPIADEVWRDAVEALGTALATATLLLDPARIVLGGGLALAGDALVTPVRAALAERLTWRPAPPVTASLLGLDAGIRGAALVGRRRAPLVAAAQREQP